MRSMHSWKRCAQRVHGGHAPSLEADRGAAATLRTNWRSFSSAALPAQVCLPAGYAPLSVAAWCAQVMSALEQRDEAAAKMDSITKLAVQVRRSCNAPLLCTLRSWHAMPSSASAPSGEPTHCRLASPAACCTAPLTVPATTTGRRWLRLSCLPAWRGVPGFRPRSHDRTLPACPAGLQVQGVWVPRGATAARMLSAPVRSRARAGAPWGGACMLLTWRM